MQKGENFYTVKCGSCKVNLVRRRIIYMDGEIYVEPYCPACGKQFAAFSFPLAEKLLDNRGFHIIRYGIINKNIVREGNDFIQVR